MAVKIIKISESKSIPISVSEEDKTGIHVIRIDGVEWVRTGNKVHAAVLFNMMADHITEYMNYV